MRLDIVMPAHNEEHRIGATLAAYRAGCAGTDCRHLAGLDNCTDATGVRSSIRMHRRTRRSSGYVLVRYEDLVADPGSELRRILDAIDEQATVPEGGMVTFRNDHTVAGNPIRFKRGDTELRLDGEWRRAMALPGKFAMTSLTWPGLRCYGFGSSWSPDSG